MLWAIKVAGAIFTAWFLNGLRKIIFHQHLKLVDWAEVTDESGTHIRLEVLHRRWFPPFDRE